jgi:hypothetical protein
MKTFIMIFVIIFSLKSFPQNSTITVKSKINYLLGLALGNPNDVNAVGGLYYKNYGIKISGGAWLIKKYGIQIDLEYVLSSQKDIKHQLSFLFAYSHNYKSSNQSFFFLKTISEDLAHDKYNNSFYSGIAYSFSWRGFFIQLGPAWGTGNFEKPKLVSQLGYFYFFD